MFLNALSFNQDIGNWDVSNSHYFVSTVMNVNVIIYESSHMTHIIILSFLVIFVFRITCLLEHCHLTKTLAIGMCQVAKAL